MNQSSEAIATTEEAGEFEPRIIAFLCKWCSSAGSDLAGVTRTQYPANIVPITVMCSGSVSPVYIFFRLQ